MNKDDEVMNDKDKMLIVSYYALAWWAESLNSGFFQSPLFERMPFKNEFVKERLRSGEASTALILPCLYASLVLPKESLNDEKYKSKFSKIDEWLDTVVIKKFTSYPKDVGGINFTYHIRNAVSHNRVEMIMGDGDNVVGIRFRDKDGGKEFMAEILVECLGCLVHKLQDIMLMRINEIKEKQRMM